jgi:hypothetical protein
MPPPIVFRITQLELTHDSRQLAMHAVFCEVQTFVKVKRLEILVVNVVDFARVDFASKLEQSV